MKRSKSIFTYFAKENTSTDNVNVLPSLDLNSIPGISSREASHVLTEVNDNMNRVADYVGKRRKYKEEGQLRIAKYASENTPTKAVTSFSREFPTLAESTIRPWVKKYRSGLKSSQLTSQGPNTSHIRIGIKRGRPLLLPEELDSKLKKFLICLRSAGGGINKHVVFGALMGFIKADLEKWGQYIEFEVSAGWLHSLYARLNFVKRFATTSRPNITRQIWYEIRHLFLHDIAEFVIKYQIPDELIINVDQTPSKLVSVDKVTMAVKGSKHVSKFGISDKRAITVTLCQTLKCKMLPFQLIYTGKTQRSLPSVKFPKGFCLSFYESHWSNEKETLRLLNKIIEPYIEKMKVKLGLPAEQKTLLIWDSFRAQECESVKDRLDELGIVFVLVPKNLTHLLQPLDLTTNLKFKEMEKKSFSDYFTECIQKQLMEDPQRDATTIEVDIRLSTLKPRHGKLMGEMYDYFQTKDGKRIIASG